MTSGIKYASVGNLQGSIFGDSEKWIPHNLPEKSVGISEVSRVSAPKSFLRGLRDSRSGTLGLGDDPVYFFSASCVVSERDSGETAAVGRDLRVLRKLMPEVERERDCSRLKEYDAFRFCHGSSPPEALVKFAAAREIRYSQRNNAKTLFHVAKLPRHSLAEFGDVRHVMASVPGIERQRLLQSHRPKFGMAESAFPVLRSERAQQSDPAVVERIEKGK